MQITELNVTMANQGPMANQGAFQDLMKLLHRLEQSQGQDCSCNGQQGLSGLVQQLEQQIQSQLEQQIQSLQSQLNALQSSQGALNSNSTFANIASMMAIGAMLA